jgi:hypothetical protein
MLGWYWGLGEIWLESLKAKNITQKGTGHYTKEQFYYVLHCLESNLLYSK